MAQPSAATTSPQPNATQIGWATTHARQRDGVSPGTPAISILANSPPNTPLTTAQSSTGPQASWSTSIGTFTVKYGLLPSTASDRKPAVSTPDSTRRSQRTAVPRPSSSMANTTPASGVLKAAARPPAAPAAISALG
ncbi:hypothetical protein D3C86_1394880 [compost metagenome]